MRVKSAIRIRRSSLFGPDISLFHSKLLPKVGDDGTAIPWHYIS